MKLTIHPMFAAVGIISAVFGGLPIFLIYTLTALLHECGHIFCARKMGFECTNIRLMPYGASALYDLEGISPADELRLALAGPAVNLALCVAVAGLWWFAPVTYAYTDTLMQANAVMLAINLLPAFPLDGGRAARCALTAVFSQKIADMTLHITAVIIAITIVVINSITIFNLSLYIFALFLLISCFERQTKAVKINFATAEKLKRGLEVKYVLVSADVTYRKAIRFLDDKKYVVLITEDGDKLTQDELYEGFATCNIYDKVFG